MGKEGKRTILHASLNWHSIANWRQAAGITGVGITTTTTTSSSSSSLRNLLRERIEY